MALHTLMLRMPQVVQGSGRRTSRKCVAGTGFGLVIATLHRWIRGNRRALFGFSIQARARQKIDKYQALTWLKAAARRPR
jgi:hypothetical protein